MSKLIGTNPNQVPSNADLGTAAFKDVSEFLTSRGSSLSAIDSVIGKTASSVFVYDTSKDSDGGAWRSRTQTMSWYNEELNTTVRGSRKEFPSVAVVVAEASEGVTIYDGDDPNLPMWMTFKRESYAQNWLSYINVGYAGTIVTRAIMINGELIISIGKGYGGLLRINFLEDNCKILYAGFNERAMTGTISQRQRNYATQTISTRQILNRNCNYVDATVLDSAPINEITGLPKPTIAISTDGGVAVIREYDTIHSISITSTYKASDKIAFISGNRIAFNANQSTVSTAFYRYVICDIPNRDITGQAYWQSYGDLLTRDYAYSNYVGNQAPALFTNSGVSGNITAIQDTSIGNAIGGIGSLTYLSADQGTPAKDMAAHITNEYNTGWMPGECKVATLMDSTEGTIYSPQLVASADFTSTTGWFYNGTGVSVGSGWTIDTASGSANYSGAGGDLYAEVNVVAGETYSLDFFIDLTANAGPLNNISWGFRQSNNAGYYVLDTQTTLVAGQVQNKTITWTSTVTGTVLARIYSDEVLSIKEISVRKAEKDRTHHKQGLRIHGTLNKRQVATGSDIVAYSGWSDDNYMMQRYNADLNFGTGDFYVVGWLKGTTDESNDYAISWNTSYSSPSGNPRWGIRASAGANPIGLNFNGSMVADTTIPTDGTWQHVCFTRKGGIIRGYVDGVLRVTTYNATSLSGTHGSLKLGNWTSGSYTFQGGELALWRVGDIGLIDEQVAKMYSDEQAMFRENAKSTLYGTSSNVTAMSYDTDTDLLHVGTSSGRSVFNGLCRVDESSNAVDTSISAQNGLVVEE